MEQAALERVLQVVLSASPDAPPTPSSVTLALRMYVATGDDAARVAVEHGLAFGAAAADSTPDPRDRVRWLRTLAEAAPCTSDDGLTAHVERALPSAIDGLESAVRQSYEPGEGLLGASVADQIRCAAALLAGFDLTGRLPYAMLADELMTTVRRQSWDHLRGRYAADLPIACLAAAVCCRLAALHADADYRARAVVAPSATYREDARRLLVAVSTESPQEPASAAEYGVALLEWFALEAILQ